MIHRAVSYMIINVRARNKEMYSVREAIIIFWLSWWSSLISISLHLSSPYFPSLSSLPFFLTQRHLLMDISTLHAIYY